MAFVAARSWSSWVCGSVEARVEAVVDGDDRVAEARPRLGHAGVVGPAAADERAAVDQHHGRDAAPGPRPAARRGRAAAGWSCSTSRPRCRTAPRSRSCPSRAGTSASSTAPTPAWPGRPEHQRLVEVAVGALHLADGLVLPAGVGQLGIGSSTAARSRRPRPRCAAPGRRSSGRAAPGRRARGSRSVASSYAATGDVDGATAPAVHIACEWARAAAVATVGHRQRPASRPSPAPRSASPVICGSQAVAATSAPTASAATPIVAAAASRPRPDTDPMSHPLPLMSRAARYRTRPSDTPARRQNWK